MTMDAESGIDYRAEYEAECERSRQLVRLSDGLLADYKRARDSLDSSMDSIIAANNRAKGHREEASLLRDELRRRLIHADEPDCEACEGTGGQPIERETYTADRMEIADLIVIGHSDPDESPCDECMGTGLEIK